MYIEKYCFSLGGHVSRVLISATYQNCGRNLSFATYSQSMFDFKKKKYLKIMLDAGLKVKCYSSVENS